jgi:hypothetical protein
MPSADNVRVGQTGLCEVAPLGTVLPATPDAALDAAFIDLGEVSEDGLEAAFTTDYSTVKNWSGAVLRSFNTSTEVTFKLTFLETNGDVLSLFYGQEAVDTAGNLNVKLSNPNPDPRALVITVIDGAELKRYCITNAQVTERGSVMDKNSEATSYEITFSANYDDALDGFGYLQTVAPAEPASLRSTKKAATSAA